MNIMATKAKYFFHKRPVLGHIGRSQRNSLIPKRAEERLYFLISQNCTLDLKFLLIMCQTFYLPREFSVVFITEVYIPPQGKTRPVYHQLQESASCLLFLGILTKQILGEWTKQTTSMFLVPTVELKPSTNSGEYITLCHTHTWAFQTTLLISSTIFQTLLWALSPTMMYREEVRL